MKERNRQKKIKIRSKETKNARTGDEAAQGGSRLDANAPGEREKELVARL